jgi:hypothetical protein
MAMEIFRNPESKDNVGLYDIMEEKEFELCSRLTEELMETKVHQLTDKFYLLLGKLIWEGNKVDHSIVERIIHSNTILRDAFYEKINNEVALMAYQDKMNQSKRSLQKMYKKE